MYFIEFLIPFTQKIAQVFLTCRVEAAWEEIRREAASRIPKVRPTAHALVVAVTAVVEAWKATQPFSGDEKSATAASQLFHSPLLTSFVLEPDLKRECS
jgi:hypothetical protein